MMVRVVLDGQNVAQGYGFHIIDFTCSSARTLVSRLQQATASGASIDVAHDLEMVRVRVGVVVQLQF